MTYSYSGLTYRYLNYNLKVAVKAFHGSILTLSDILLLIKMTNNGMAKLI